MARRPNILFIMTDDHASHAMSCYGSRINETPHMDRIANEGMRFDNCFCTNSICTPSRAVILTGTHSHVNGVTTLATHMDNRLPTYPKMLRAQGYQTALFGKWHLGTGPAHCPTGFDDWAVVPGQGMYHDPEFIFPGSPGGDKRTVNGYATDIITDMCLDWLDKRDASQPFCLMCHHKAPHRPWEPDAKHARMFEGVDVPEPDTLYDDYANRGDAARVAAMRVGEHMSETDLKHEIPPGLEGHALRKWAYQHYIKDYLRVVAAVDDNIGRLLDYLDREGLADDTLVIYTSDQGFFLGDHGWYDKRFMYEESLRMPFIARYPREIKPGSVCGDMVLNLDFAPTFLDLAGMDPDPSFQGRSFRSILNGDTPSDWRAAMYYRYWMNRSHHNVAAHYGIRTHTHKLIYYYADGMGTAGSDQGFCAGPVEYDPAIHDIEPQWELFDLRNDPCEMNSIVNDPAQAAIVSELKDRLHKLQAACGDEPHGSDT